MFDCSHYLKILVKSVLLDTIKRYSFCNKLVFVSTALILKLHKFGNVALLCLIGRFNNVKMTFGFTTKERKDK